MSGHLADRQPRLTAARQQLRATREGVPHRGVVWHAPPLHRVVLVQHEPTADRVVLAGRDVGPLWTPCRKAHSVGVEEKSLAWVHDHVLDHVEVDGVPCEQVEATGLPRGPHRGLRDPGVDVLR